MVKKITIRSHADIVLSVKRSSEDMARQESHWDR